MSQRIGQKISNPLKKLISAIRIALFVKAQLCHPHKRVKQISLCIILIAFPSEPFISEIFC
jgi:hypothetical protein